MNLGNKVYSTRLIFVPCQFAGALHTHRRHSLLSNKGENVQSQSLFLALDLVSLYLRQDCYSNTNLSCHSGMRFSSTGTSRPWEKILALGSFHCL